MPRSRRKLNLVLLLLAAFATGAVLAQYHLLPYATIKSMYTAVFGGGGGDDQPNDQRPTGAWYPNQHVSGDPPSDKLAAFPYGRGGQNRAPEVVSVTVLETDLADHGLNLIVSGHAAEAFLVDMKGQVRHRWRREIEQIWPGPLGFDEYEVHKQFWRRAHAFPNGDLLAIFEGIGMVKLDRDAKLIWAHKGRCHHDLFVAGDGTIYTLSRHPREKHPRFPSTGAILEDFVTVLSPDGEEIERISILDAFLDSDYAATLTLAAKRGDILHTNTIELMDGRFASRHPMFAAGNVLLSVPSLNTIAVLDPTQKKIVWALGGLWTFQHQPTVLDDGRILVFDNRGESGKSRVVEIDPLTQEIIWAYRNTEEHPLFSPVIGSSQRLANGNTLITESTTGRALEVTREGRIAWEFLNPERAGEMIACLYEVVRLPSDYFEGEFAELLAVVPDEELDLSGVDALVERASGAVDQPGK